MTRPQAADYEGRREAMKGKVAALFARLGFNGTSVADMAEACGVSKSLLYHYFDSKENLLFEVMTSHLDLLDAEVDAVLALAWPPLDKLRELMRRFMTCYVETANSQKVVLNELSNLPEARRAMIIGRQRRLVDVVQHLLSEVNPGDPVRGRAETMLLFGMINWTHTWFDPAGRFSAQDIADMAVERAVQPASSALFARARAISGK